MQVNKIKFLIPNRNCQIKLKIVNANRAVIVQQFYFQIVNLIIKIQENKELAC